jgi:hypothetical protein
VRLKPLNLLICCLNCNRLCHASCFFLMQTPVAMIAMVAASGGLLFGFDNGITGGTLMPSMHP